MQKELQAARTGSRLTFLLIVLKEIHYYIFRKSFSFSQLERPEIEEVSSKYTYAYLLFFTIFAFWLLPYFTRKLFVPMFLPKNLSPEMIDFILSGKFQSQ